MSTHPWPGPRSDARGYPADAAVLAARWQHTLARLCEAFAPPRRRPYVGDAPGGGTPRRLRIVWDAFPRSATRCGEDAALDALHPDSTFTTRGPGGAQRPLRLWARAQNEYVEWRAESRSAVVFTSELLEYWELLAQGAPSPYSVFGVPGTARGSAQAAACPALRAHVGRLYQRLVPGFRAAEHTAQLFFARDVLGAETGGPLFFSGTYNPWNTWNTRSGLVHLTHRASTLRAAVALLAGAAFRRSRAPCAGPDVDAPAAADTEVEDVVELLGRCLLVGGGGLGGEPERFGDPNRSSDAAIAGALHEVVRSHRFVLAPRGLTFTLLAPDTTGWRWRDGPLRRGDVRWEVLRHLPDEGAVRARLATRGGRPLAELLLDGRPYEGPRHLARHVRAALNVDLLEVAPGPRGLMPAFLPRPEPCALHPAALRLRGACGHSLARPLWPPGASAEAPPPPGPIAATSRPSGVSGRHVRRAGPGGR